MENSRGLDQKKLEFADFQGVQCEKWKISGILGKIDWKSRVSQLQNIWYPKYGGTIFFWKSQFLHIIQCQKEKKLEKHTRVFDLSVRLRPHFGVAQETPFTFDALCTIRIHIIGTFHDRLCKISTTPFVESNIRRKRENENYY